MVSNLCLHNTAVQCVPNMPFLTLKQVLSVYRSTSMLTRKIIAQTLCTPTASCSSIAAKRTAAVQRACEVFSIE